MSQLKLMTMMQTMRDKQNDPRIRHDKVQESQKVLGLLEFISKLRLKKCNVNTAYKE